MIVIGDSSVISNFIHLDKTYILQQLYTEIIIPVEVQKELHSKQFVLPNYIKTELVKDTSKILNIVLIAVKLKQ